MRTPATRGAVAALGALLALVTRVPDARAVLSKDALACQNAIGKAVLGFQKAKLKAWGKCLDGVLAGKPCDTAARDAAIGASVGKAAATIAAKCTDAVAFGAPPNGVGFPLDCHYEVPPLEPYEAGCHGLPVGNVAQLAACLTCWTEGEVDEYLKVVYPCLQGTIPNGSDPDCGTPPGSCPDPTAGKAEVSCLKTVAKYGRKRLLAEEKATGKCLGAVAAGRIAGPCPDGPTATKLASAAQTAHAAIAARCPALPGWWDVCPEGEPCGPALATVDAVATCTLDAAGEIVDELLCEQYPDHPGIGCPPSEGTTTTSTTVGSTTSTTTIDPCCTSLPSLLAFRTASSGCGTNPPGSVTPARCVQGTNTGVTCSSDAICTGGGTCRGHLDCAGLYFGSGQPAGIALPGVVPDNDLSYSLIASCSGDTINLTATAASDVPGPGCSTPSGTPTWGQRHCTSPGCLFGAPLALPNSFNPATGTCVINVISASPGAGTGSATCSDGDVASLLLPLDSQVYLTGAIEPTKVCSACIGGTLGVCGSGTCAGGPRDGLACTPETSALSGSYPTSHDCPPPNAPGGVLASCADPPSGTFIGCLPIAFDLSTGTQSKSSFSTSALARVFCGFCFDANVSTSYENPPHPCTADADCTNGNFTECRQHNNGAFRNSLATTYSETGTPAGVILADGLSHAATLVSAFCIPPSYDPIVDPSGELPGPGAVSLPGAVQLIP